VQKKIWWLCFTLLLGCQPAIDTLVETSIDETQESGYGEVDTYFPDLPELQQDNTVTEKPNYDFLDDENFWQAVKEIAFIPDNKSCSNKESYAYFGIARLVYERIYGDLRLLPFGNKKRFKRFYESYPEDTSSHELYLTTGLMKRLNEITRFTNADLGIPLTITALTLYSGEKHDFHCRHRAGTTLDIRPFPASQPMTWRDSAYDLNMNLQFIRYLVAKKDVTLIYFNDKRLQEDEVVIDIMRARAAQGNSLIFRSVGGHDNHYHIEFKVDTEVDLVTRFIRSQIDISQAQP